jgi:hypothetical protein
MLQGEIDRRIHEAKKTDPFGQREQYLNREQSRVQNKIDRLLTAYQEELITLEQLRQRMPELRKQEKALRSELKSLHMAATDRARYLRVVDSLQIQAVRLLAPAGVRISVIDCVRGVIVPPCGVPCVVSWKTSFSMYPAFSHSENGSVYRDMSQ